MAPIPHAPISAAWCANSTLSRKQQLPTCTITLKSAGACFTHSVAKAFLSSVVSM